MLYFVVYDAATGALGYQASTTMSAEMAVLHWPRGEAQDLALIEGPLVQPLRHYRVSEGKVVERSDPAITFSVPSFAADGVAECVLSGLPDPCTVTITGAVSAGPLEVTGGSLTITSTTPGAITISITANPVWKPWEGVINAT
jgi:hypothetical protein